MNILPALRPSFWFDLTPVALSPFFERFFFVVFALFVIAAAAARIAIKSKQREKYEKLVMQRAAGIMMSYGIVGFVIYFFTYEEVRFFGARFWFLVWGVALIYSVVRLIRFARKEVPLLRHRDQSRVEANKYMPRSNRR